MASSSQSGTGPGALVPRSTFQQGGVIDWVGLSNTSFSFTLDVLKRLSNAGVEPFTLCVGQMIGNNLRANSLGLQNIEDAISKLPRSKSFSDVLWFGFGVRSLPRSLATTQQGSLCLALCAILAEHYPVHQAAKILTELVRLYEAPDDFAPSLKQWAALIHACEGVFALSTYPLIIAQLSRPLYQQIDPQSARNTSAKAVADAIWLMGRVSRDDAYSIKLSGLSDMLWLGSFAVWALGLPVMFFAQTGEVIYSNCRPGEERITIHLENQMTQNPVDLRTTTTFHLDSYREFIIEGGVDTLYVCARVPWDTCLSVTFGDAFQTISRSSTVFGLLIGSIARTFSELRSKKCEMITALAAIGISHLAIRIAVFGSSNSHGKGLVQNLCNYFPELTFARPAMEEAVERSFAEAKDVLRSSLSNLESTCNCRICKCKRMSIPSLGDSKCLVAVCAAIIDVAQKLSMVTVEQGLYPTQVGLQDAYISRTDPYSNMVDHRGEWSFEMDYLGALSFVEEMMGAVGGLFIATKFGEHLRQTGSAYSRAGICLYLDQLCQISDVTIFPYRIHVLPGQIEYLGRSFTHVEGYPEGNHRLSLDMIRMDDRVKSVSLLVEEEMDHLLVSYLIEPQKAAPFKADPRLLEAAGLKCNDIDDCAHLDGSAENKPRDHDEMLCRQYADQNSWNLGVFEGSMLERYIAAAIITRCYGGSSSLCIIRQGTACLSCCLERAVCLHPRSVLILQNGQHCRLTLGSIHALMEWRPDYDPRG